MDTPQFFPHLLAPSSISMSPRPGSPRAPAAPAQSPLWVPLPLLIPEMLVFLGAPCCALSSLHRKPTAAFPMGLISISRLSSRPLCLHGDLLHVCRRTSALGVSSNMSKTELIINPQNKTKQHSQHNRTVLLLVGFLNCCHELPTSSNWKPGCPSP